jgi:hypothetical protein
MAQHEHGPVPGSAQPQVRTALDHDGLGSFAQESVYQAAKEADAAVYPAQVVTGRLGHHEVLERGEHGVLEPAQPDQQSGLSHVLD